LAGIYNFILIDVVFEVLDDLYPEVKIVLSMSVDKLADILPLLWTLFDDLAVVLEEMANEELVEFLSWAV
jgi:hypothetical protein